MPLVNTHYVVIDDPTNEYWEGSLLDANRANILAGRGVAMLPVLPDALRSSGVGGYSKRCWGAGWPLDTTVPRHVCPLTLFCEDPAVNQLRWLARVVPERDDMDWGKLQGDLRLVQDGHQMSANRLGLTQRREPVPFAKLGAPDERGGWTLGGLAAAHFAAPACYGLSLYGRGPGLRVIWAAASLGY